MTKQTVAAAATLAAALLWAALAPPAVPEEAPRPSEAARAPDPKAVAPAVPSGPGDDPRSVLVLYRANCPDFNKDGTGDSEEIARWYAQRRGVPRENLLGIKVPGPTDDIYQKSSTWTYADFQSRLVQPLRAKLKEIGPEKVLYIVTVFGLPERVAVPNSNRPVSADAVLSNPFLTRDDGPHPKAFYTAPRDGDRYGAPRFAAARARWQGTDAPDNVSYLVTRLDGLGAPAVKALVDGALYAETFEVEGYAYVDNRYGVYEDKVLDAWQAAPHYFSYQDNDHGIALAGRFMRAAGLTVRQQPDYDVIGSSDKLKYTDGTSAGEAPRALMYGGWYNYGQYNNVFDWLPGSVAIDFDSASLFAPRQVMGSFGGMALLYGASGAVGCFDEPYSNGHPQPDVLFAYYVRGYNFAEASWLSMPRQPFVNMAIGDPLMRPYGRKRVPDTKLEAPKVTWTRDGDTIRADIEMGGDVEIARARLTTAPSRDDTLLPPATRRDGSFRREMTLTIPAPRSGSVLAGLVLTDPAGNTLRLWKDF